MKHLRSGLAGAALAALPALAQAQTAAPASTGLEEITVTSQRVAQSLQRVPVAVSAFSGNDLENRQAINLQDLKEMVPNLYLEENLSNTSTPKMYIRGIGLANSAFSFDSPIGIYVDDVYYARVIGSLVDFFDIDRVEVLRGPQGTIYGRNASIGAIRLVTKKPPLDQFDFKADATYGTENQINARIAVGVPLVQDKVGFRFAYNTKNNDGFQTNLSKHEKVKSDDVNAMRAQLLFKPDDSLSVILRADYLRDRSRETAASSFVNNPDNDLLTFNSNRSYADGTAVNRLDTWGFSGTVDWDLGAAKLTSITAYRGIGTRKRFDADGSDAALFEVDRGDLHEREFTQEVFASGSSLGTLPVEWVAGSFYLHETNRYLWSLRIVTPPSTQLFSQTVDTIAGYAQGTYRVTDRLGLTAGFRYTYEHKDFDADSVKPDGSFDFAYRNHDLALARWTWRAAAEYQLQERVMAYASVSTGFRSGGLNGNATSLADVTAGGFGPEDTRMYEIGVKSELLDRRLILNLAGYYGDYTGLQQAVTRTDGTVSNVSNNATVYGVELEARALPLPGLELSLTLGTMHSEIENSSLVLNFPKLNYTLSGLYSWQLGRLGTASIGGSYAYTASFFGDTNNTPILKTPSHAIANAYVSLRLPDDQWKFTLAGYNLTDKIYDIGSFYIAGGRLSAVKYPNLPRRVEFTAQYRF